MTDDYSLTPCICFGIPSLLILSGIYSIIEIIFKWNNKHLTVTIQDCFLPIAVGIIGILVYGYFYSLKMKK